MTRDQFYAASMQRDEEMRRRSVRRVTALMVANCLPLVLLLVELPSPVEPFVLFIYAVYMMIVLIAYVAITRKKEKSIHNEYGMVCTHYGDFFSGSSLAHIGFIGVCRKCGNHVSLGQ